MARYRWQILAFLVSVFIFGLALVSRLSTPTSPSITATPDTANQTLAVTATDTSSVLATPLPTSDSTSIQATMPAQSVTLTNDDVPTLREALVGRIQRLNPLYADLNPIDRDIVSLIFSGLIKINEFGEPVGDLAKTWVISRDGLEYVLTLRDDILWQDGERFSADDVVYTMSLLHDPKFDGLTELGVFWRTVETEKLAPHIVRFRLTQPLSSFLTALTIGILPEHALRGTTATELATHPFNLSPIGTGAYQLEALRSPDGTSIQRVDLRVAPTFRQRAEGANGYAIERVSFVLVDSVDEAIALLNTGEVDTYATRNRTERPALLTIGNTTAYTNIAPAVGMLIYNWDEGENTRFFQELRARVALQRGLNRVAPVEANLINQAIVADSPILPNSWAYTPNIAYPNTDSAQALDLLLNSNIRTNTISPEATAEPQDVSEIFAFGILVRDDPSLVALAREIATQWSQLRLSVTVEAVDDATYQTRLNNGEFNTAIVELPLSADPDPFAYWHVGQAPDGKNYGALADDRLSELLERARRDPYGINRIQLYRQFQEGFIERAVAIPLFYPLYTYTVSIRVQNVQLSFLGSPIDRFRNIGEWVLG
jgi:peptide/nickel transport system substrate-binding protein